MPVEEEIIGSQTEDSEQHDSDQDDPKQDVFAAFGLEKPKEETKTEEKETDPAKDQPKKLTVKYNKEDVEVEEARITELVEKGMNLDKVRGQKTELEKHLDRAAKLAGYKDHAAFVADLDNLEQQQQQKEQNKHNELLEELRQQADDAGLDPDKVAEFLNNHPLVKEGEQAKQERENERKQRLEETTQQEVQQKWDSMYTNPRVLAVFPNIVEDSKAWERGENPKFLTPEMQSKIERGYDPLDAIILAHADKFQTVSKKVTEQRIIKEQQLGLRSKVETSSDRDNEPQVSAALANAFEAFGLPPEAAHKYKKK